MYIIYSDERVDTKIKVIKLSGMACESVIVLTYIVGHVAFVKKDRGNIIN